MDYVGTTEEADILRMIAELMQRVASSATAPDDAAYRRERASNSM